MGLDSEITTALRILVMRGVELKGTKVMRGVEHKGTKVLSTSGSGVFAAGSSLGVGGLETRQRTRQPLEARGPPEARPPMAKPP